jgi:hypothetical protein
MGLSGQEAVLERILDQLGAGGDLELALDACTMGLDRAYAQEELGGYLAIRVAEGDEPQNLDLALAQAVNGNFHVK